MSPSLAVPRRGSQSVIVSMTVPSSTNSRSIESMQPTEKIRKMNIYTLSSWIFSVDVSYFKSAFKSKRRD